MLQWEHNSKTNNNTEGELMSVYDEVEREAREDHRAWLADEWEGFDPSDWESNDPTECPACGGPLTVEPADYSVGIMSEAVFCENVLPDGTDCLWPPQE